MLHLDSIVVCVDSPTEAERLTTAGGDVLHWRGVVPSAEGGAVTWASAVVRLPAATALRLGLIVLDEGLRDRGEHAAVTPPAPTAPATTPPTVARTSSGVSLAAPQRHRSRRRLRRAIQCETTTMPHRVSLPTGTAEQAAGHPDQPAHHAPQTGHERPG